MSNKLIDFSQLDSTMSNRLFEGGRESMKQKEGSTMKKLSRNTLQLGEKFKEL